MASVYLFRESMPAISPLAYVDPAAHVVGTVTLGEGSSVWANAVIRGDNGAIRIGARSNVQDGALLNATWDDDTVASIASLSIGDDVSIGRGAILQCCTIADAVSIGAHARILSGVQIARHSMVGAGARVEHGSVIGEGEVWIGNPARCVRLLSAAEIESIHTAARNYMRRRARYLDALRQRSVAVLHEFDRRLSLR